MTDSAGQVVAFYGDDAFGVGRYAAPGSAGTGATDERYRFAGEPYDAETQHYSLRARRYDPATGRFTTPDPIGYLGGDNLYAYADNNPVATTDPSGLGGDVSTERGPGYEQTPLPGMGRLTRGQSARLARVRRALGLPERGSPADSHTVAILEVDGEVFVGRSGHGQPVEFAANATSISHAEIHALSRLVARRAITGQTGGRARLLVDRAPCLACGQNGAIRAGVRAAGLESLEIAFPPITQFHVRTGPTWTQAYLRGSIIITP